MEVKIWTVIIVELVVIGCEKMTNQERIDNYKKVTGYPQSMFIDETGRINGVWIMGNNYKTKGDYGCLSPETMILKDNLVWTRQDSQAQWLPCLVRPSASYVSKR